MTKKMEQQQFALRHIFIKIDKLCNKVAKIKARGDKDDAAKLTQIEDSLVKVQLLVAELTGDADTPLEN